LRLMAPPESRRTKPRLHAAPDASVVLLTTARRWRAPSTSYLNIAHGLLRQGIGVLVATTSADIAQEFWLSRLPVIELRRGPLGLLQLRRLLAKERTSALLVDGVRDVENGALAVMGTSTVLVGRCSYFGSDGFAPAINLPARLALRLAPRELVFVSASARDEALSHAPFLRHTAARTIYDGIDTTVFHRLDEAAAMFRKSFDLGAEPFVMCSGPLSADKRLGLVFQALARLGADAPLLVLCGDGEDEPRLRRLAYALGLAVRFVGRIPPYILAGAYSAATALVAAGAAEAHGLGVLEAMACACPVIASVGGIHAELIGEDGASGTLCAANSRNALADAIHDIVIHPKNAEAMGRAAAQRARTLFSVQAMQRAYVALFRRYVAVGGLKLDQ
jgi:glycosyltransferase involved in cell wall biosynthesis